MALSVTLNPRVDIRARSRQCHYMLNDLNDSAQINAVLGPTNTGKTHYAMSRMLGHSSGIMGFPLRLLARENYDRAVAQKGPDQVALITGEEKIVPKDARWYLCTVESMPLEKDVAFIGFNKTYYHVKSSCLSSAIWPQKTNYFTLVNFYRHIVYNNARLIFLYEIISS